MFTCLTTTQQRQVKSPRDPGVVSLHVNAGHFSTTARRVTSPTWGPPPPCKQALSLGKYWKLYRATVGSRFTSFSRVLPKSRVVYCACKPIERVVYCLNKSQLHEPKGNHRTDQGRINRISGYKRWTYTTS